MTAQEIRRFGIEAAGRFYGTYMAVVEDNSEYNTRGKLRVRVIDVVGPRQISAIAYYKGVVGKGMGLHWVPKVGEVVFVEFRKGLMAYPFWSHSFYAKGEKNDEFTADEIAFTFPDGTYVKNNHKDNALEIVHKSGYSYQVDDSGISQGNEKKQSITSRGLQWDDEHLAKSSAVEQSFNDVIDIINTVSSAMDSIIPGFSGTLKPFILKLKQDIKNLPTT
jgi:hypothetical protein